jgi:YbbR domain-containing protein
MASPAINHPFPPRHEHDAPVLIGPPPRRRMSLAGLIQRLRRNMAMRLLSLAIAVGLWLFVNAGQHGSQQTFVVPLLYRGMPPGFVITNQHPDNVHVQVTGPRTLLSLIDPTRLAQRVDLSGVGIGQMQFRLNPEQFGVPRGTNVTSVTPSQLTLDVDRVVERAVPVKLALTGILANGYEIRSETVVPPEVTIRGPSRDVARIDSVTTEPFSVDKANADDSGTVDLAALPGTIRLESEAVTAEVIIGPILIQKQFRAITVEVRNDIYRYRIAPTRANVTLHGPVLVLEALKPKGLAFIDADSVPPGIYDLPVQVNLPDGVDLVKQMPVKVRLFVYHQKLGAD